MTMRHFSCGKHLNQATLIAACVILSSGAVIFPNVRACANDRVVISAALKEQYKRPDKIPFPKENPYSKAKESLGKILFFEPRISRSGVMSCATCHNPGFGWTDSNPKGVGDFHKILPRKDPTILNLAWDKLFFWDGRAEGLEMQALMPIQADGEMHISADDMTQRLKSINEYAQLFKKAFPEDPDPIRSENVARALATFERTVISGIAPFDLWIQGDKTAIPESAKRGFLIFNKKAQCAACHSGWNFSDGSFHDIGIDDDDIGRGKWLSLSVMQHAFKTVGLREIERRAPYMHNGSLPSLLDVVNHYDHGFVARESLAGEVKPLHLTEQEKTDLVAFLKTLTSHNEPVIIPQLPR